MPYRVINQGNLNVMDSSRGSNKGHILTYDWNGGQNQMFNLKQIGQNQYVIEVVDTGKVLDIKGEKSADGTQIIQYNHHGGENQRFKLQRSQQDPTYYQIKSSWCGKVLERNKNNKVVLATDKKGDKNQLWKFEEI